MTQPGDPELPGQKIEETATGSNSFEVFAGRGLGNSAPLPSIPPAKGILKIREYLVRREQLPAELLTWVEARHVEVGPRTTAHESVLDLLKITRGLLQNIGENKDQEKQPLRELEQNRELRSVSDELHSITTNFRAHNNLEPLHYEAVQERINPVKEAALIDHSLFTVLLLLRTLDDPR